MVTHIMKQPVVIVFYNIKSFILYVISSPCCIHNQENVEIMQVLKQYTNIQGKLFLFLWFIFTTAFFKSS